MSISEQPPVACCLSTSEYQSRIAWIKTLTHQFLREHSRDDLVLRLFYAPEAAAEVGRMVEQERTCCAFLVFEMDHRPDAVCVTITAPEAAREAADMLFGQFLTGEARSCGRICDKLNQVVHKGNAA
jgi:hypothetical protein